MVPASASHASSSSFACALLVLAVSAGCKEEGTINVHSLTFKGVKRVDERS